MTDQDLPPEVADVVSEGDPAADLPVTPPSEASEQLDQMDEPGAPGEVDIYDLIENAVSDYLDDFRQALTQGIEERLSIAIQKALDTAYTEVEERIESLESTVAELERRHEDPETHKELLSSE